MQQADYHVNSVDYCWFSLSTGMPTVALGPLPPGNVLYSTPIALLVIPGRGGCHPASHLAIFAYYETHRTTLKKKASTSKCLQSMARVRERHAGGAKSCVARLFCAGFGVRKLIFLARKGPGITQTKSVPCNKTIIITPSKTNVRP